VLIVAITWFYSCNIAIHYVLPVLWKLCLVFAQLVNGGRIKDNIMFCRVRQVAAPAVKLLPAVAGL